MFNLLEALSSDEVTTPQQRESIRAIVTDFLNNELPHGRVYAYIGSVVGCDTLHAVIRRLEMQPDRPAVPDAAGLARIEAAFGLSKTPSSAPPAPPAPTSAEAPPSPPAVAPFKREDVFNKVKWLPVRRTLSVGPLYGHSSIVFSHKLFLFGGRVTTTKLVPFSACSVINLTDFTSRTFSFSGDVPSNRYGHTANLVTTKEGTAVLLFGGVHDKPQNDLYSLAFDTKRWRVVMSAPPCCRYEHSAVAHPAKSDPAQEGFSHTTCLFVFGGKGTNNETLNDLWSLKLETMTWTQIQTSSAPPPPRCGSCLVWADDRKLCVFGGQLSGPDGKEEMLADMWTCQLNESNEEWTGEWSVVKSAGQIDPTSNFASIVIMQKFEDDSTERLLLVNGGMAMHAQETKPRESDAIYVYFFSQNIWVKLKPRYPTDYCGDSFAGRQKHIGCFFEARAAGAVPCVVVHGGLRQSHVLADAWVLSLTGEDPYVVVVPPTTHATDACERDSHTPGVLRGLATEQRWLLGAIAHLVDNAVAVRATKLAITSHTTPDKKMMLCFQDDGLGLDYCAMNKLLRLYASYEPGDTNRRNYEYGLGFKNAFSRLCTSCAIMSRTHGTLGVGLLSQELMMHSETPEITAPMCMWRLPNKELISRDPNNTSDHRHHQRLLMAYTPFTTPTLLAEQINMLGTSPGTRLLFWDVRTDLDYLKLQEAADEKPRLITSALSEVMDAESIPPKDEHEFPLWSHPAYSLDYNLSTYLCWLYVHSPTTISILGSPLVPPPTTTVDVDMMSGEGKLVETTLGSCTVSPLEYKHSLVRYVKARLFRMVELHYLFKPSDSAMGGYGVVGFLNDPHGEAKYAETGVLLYFKSRLVRRLEGVFPADPSDIKLPSPEVRASNVLKPFGLTAIINVPDCLIPCTTKQSFIHEGNLPWFTFRKKLTDLLNSYLELCQDPAKLQEWDMRRRSRFERYQTSAEVPLMTPAEAPEEEEEEEVTPAAAAAGSQQKVLLGRPFSETNQEEE
eukprot:GHVS01022476.1.p1 GENE.GHVS01022476.1~~GHVS01022476.1.p1  ORF type:complete len:1167 (-),score=237.27 GHVS01022476.1:128-3157(-)